MIEKPIRSQWKLTDLYHGMDDPTLSRDFKTAEDFIETLKTYRGKIVDLNSSQLLELITIAEKLSFCFHKIDLYAGMLESTHIGDPEVTRFAKKIDETITEKSKAIIFIPVELAQMDEETWHKHLNARELAPYKNYLTNLYLDAKHTLTEPEEKILTDKNQTSQQALQHLFKVTTDTLLFEWEGKSVPMAEVLHKLYDPSGQVRKKAALTLHQGLKTNDKTTPALYNALIQDKAINDRLRHYEFPEQARFMSDQVDKDTVLAMITAVKEARGVIADYYRLKKTILKLDTFYWWDRYAPLPQAETKFTIEQAKEMVIETFTRFSTDMGVISAEVFKREHVDWLPSPTKQGGAFCAFGGNNIYPFVLLNFTESLQDIMTVAHELGHAVHDVLAQENNVFYQTHPSLAVAEIASVFGESLLTEKLLESDITSQDRISILMEAIEGSFATVFRQVAMFEFEQQAHTKRAQEGELSKDQLDDLWHTIMQEGFNKELIYTEEHKNTWMYIPHIINTPFYVYSYSFAQLCVLSLYKLHKDRGTSFVPDYMKILKAGGSLSPKENLAQIGIDITQPTFWSNGLAVIKDYIARLEQEIAQR